MKKWYVLTSFFALVGFALESLASNHNPFDLLAHHIPLTGDCYGSYYRFEARDERQGPQVSSPANSHLTNVEEEFLKKIHLVFSHRAIYEDAEKNYLSFVKNVTGTLAALKRNRVVDAMTSQFVRAMGLTNVPLCLYVEDFCNDYENWNEPFKGSIEEFVPVLRPGVNYDAVPAQTRELIAKYQHRTGCLSFQDFWSKLKEQDPKTAAAEEEWLLSNLDDSTVEEHLALFFLTHLDDMDPRNAMLQLTPQGKFKIFDIDHENPFFPYTPKIPFTFSCPQAYKPFSQKMVQVIESWTREKLTAFKPLVDHIAQRHVETLQRALKERPQMSIKQHLLLSFWNTCVSGKTFNMQEKRLKYPEGEEFEWTYMHSLGTFYLECAASNGISFSHYHLKHGVIPEDNATTLNKLKAALQQYLASISPAERSWGKFLSFVRNHPLTKDYVLLQHLGHAAQP